MFQYFILFEMAWILNEFLLINLILFQVIKMWRDYFRWIFPKHVAQLVKNYSYRVYQKLLPQ